MSEPFIPEAENASSGNALELRNVRKNFGETEIIRGVDLLLPHGDLHAIIGPNGAGKSTLFGLISGLTPLTSGEILLNGRVISGLPPYRINRLGLSRSFQITNIFPRMSVLENIRCACLWTAGEGYKFWRSANSNKAIAERAEFVLNSIQLTGRKNIPAGVLSYAEQRALEIGVSIAGGASVILLDEPTAGMSRQETERMIDLIRNISSTRTVVIVEHDMSVVFGLADRISVLVYGKIIRTDIPSAIRSCPKVKEAYLGEAAF